jgi:hypothetical protein
VTGRRGRRRRKLLNDLKERRGYSHLKKEALDHTMLRDRFGRGFGLVMRPNTERMNELINYSDFDMFRTSKCSSSGTLVHAASGISFMHPLK